MTKESPAQVALANARAKVKVLIETGRGTDMLIPLAEVEVRAAQVKQHELQNMIAMAANPNACPYPIAVVHARIKELANLG